MRDNALFRDYQLKHIETECKYAATRYEDLINRASNLE